MEQSVQVPVPLTPRVGRLASDSLLVMHTSSLALWRKHVDSDMHKFCREGAAIKHDSPICKAI